MIKRGSRLRASGPTSLVVAGLAVIFCFGLFTMILL